MRRPLITLIAVASVLVMGCWGPQSEDAARFVFESTAYGYEATIAFGTVDPAGEPAVLSGTLENLTGDDITVQSVDVEGDGYALQIPPVPFSILSGESVAASLSFSPTSSGTSTGSITVTIDGYQIPLVVNLTGTGNYAPVAYPAVTVSGAGTSAVDGTYRRVGTLTTFAVQKPQSSAPAVDYDSPTYELVGSVYKIWAVDNDNGLGWLIDDDYTYDFETFTNTALYGPGYYYVGDSAGLVAPTGQAGTTFQWSPQTGASPGPTVTGEIDSPSDGVAYQADTITANYLFVDSEGDPEGSTTFQWYASDTLDGTYEPIAGATSISYTVTASEVSKYLKVLVTPAASSGFLSGTPVFLGPLFVAELIG